MSEVVTQLPQSLLQFTSAANNSILFDDEQCMLRLQNDDVYGRHVADMPGITVFSAMQKA